MPMSKKTSEKALEFVFSFLLESLIKKGNTLYIVSGFGEVTGLLHIRGPQSMGYPALIIWWKELKFRLTFEKDLV
jgi:hypothetical protein